MSICVVFHVFLMKDFFVDSIYWGQKCQHFQQFSTILTRFIVFQLFQSPNQGQNLSFSFTEGLGGIITLDAM